MTSEHSEQLDNLGTYISLTLGDGSFAIDQSCEGALEAAYGDWHTKGANTILALTMCNGDDLVIAASLIADYCLSTPKGRASSLAFHMERDRWEAATRRASGWVPGQDE